MDDQVEIARVNDLPADRFTEMLTESEASGYPFLRRVANEWQIGSNRFSRAGEALFIAEIADRWVGVCGLSIDPYLGNPSVGRIRNVYVLGECRNAGIGRLLITCAISQAREHFDWIRLRSDREIPSRLYESLGFRRISGIANCTHVLDWSRDRCEITD